MRICFDAEGYSTPVTESSEHQSEHGSVVMAAINGTIYVIDGDYSWLSDSFGVYAIGSGAQFALGSLATTIPTGDFEVSAFAAGTRKTKEETNAIAKTKNILL